MPNFSASFSVNNATYNATPEVDLVGGNPAFLPDEFFAAVETASVVAFSFDGANDHGRVDSANYKTLQWRTHNRKMWLRIISGGAATFRVSFFTHM